jgi:hypothetical protein
MLLLLLLLLLLLSVRYAAAAAALDLMNSGDQHCAHSCSVSLDSAV